MARRPEGPPARGGGRNPGRKGRIGKPPRGKRPPRTTGPLGPPVVGSTSLPPPMPPPASDPLADLFGPTEAYLQGLMLKYKREADRNAAEKQRVAGEYAKWYSEHVPGQIQGIYGTAADQQAGFGKGFSDGFQQAQQQYASESNALLGPIGASDQAIHPTGDATDVLYGIGGAIPGATLSTQGAGFGAAAALMPGAILSEGISAGAAARKAADEKIAEIEGSLIDVRTKKAEAKLKLSEEKAKAKQDAAKARQDQAYDLYNSGVISQRELARRLGLKDWKRYPNVGKPGKAAGIDASASKLVGYLVDDNGNPIRDRKGKLIPILQEPEDLPRVSTTLSAANGYLTDVYGQPILGPKGQTQSYTPYSKPSSKGESRWYWQQGPDGSWYKVDRTGKLPPQLAVPPTGGGDQTKFRQNASEARELASQAMRGRKVGKNITGTRDIYKPFPSWQAALDWMISEGADPAFAAWALWSKGGRKLKGAPKKAPSPPKASAALSGGDQASYLASLWVQAGGDPAVANLAAAIAMGESSGNRNANLVTGAEDSRGLWQINTRAHPWSRSMNLYDPLTNAKAAVRVWKQSGKSFNPWSVYTSGKYKQYLKTGKTGPVNISYDPSVPSVVQSAIGFANQQVGQKYVWGGESRGEGGFDCSGLIDWAFRQVGIDFPGRLTTYSAMKLGSSVRGQQLKPGDLVISNDGKHMTMYVGNGMVIAASSAKGRVGYQPLSSLGRIYDVRRLNFGGRV